MDPLSQVFARLKPEAAGWRVFEASGPRTLRFVPDRNAVVFGQALQNKSEVVRDDGQRLEVAPGDFMLMASPPPWEMRAMGGGPPIDFKAMLANPGSSPPIDEAQPLTRFIGGYFKLAMASAELLARLMSPIVVIRAEEVANGRLGVLLRLLSEEAGEQRAGGTEVIRRLLEVLLVEVLRSPAVGLRDSRIGLLAGLADPKIGHALWLMHDDVAKDWTVEAIARTVGMSRSVFAERFTATVGSPPMDYLSGWRMTLAKQALTDGVAPMAEIAEIAGYRSVSAFSTAFRRTTGVSPTAYRSTTSSVDL